MATFKTRLSQISKKNGKIILANDYDSSEKNLTAKIFEKVSASLPLILESCSASSKSYLNFFLTKETTTAKYKKIRLKSIPLISKDSPIRTMKTPTRRTMT